MTEITELLSQVLNFTRFSSKSDVWAYGVLCWEVFTCGDMPYGRAKNPEVVERVQRGQILGQPSNCPNKVYEVRTSSNTSTFPLTRVDLPGDEALLGHATRGQTRLQSYQGEVSCHQPRLERGLANTSGESETYFVLLRLPFIIYVYTVYSTM